MRQSLLEEIHILNVCPRRAGRSYGFQTLFDSESKTSEGGGGNESLTAGHDLAN